MKILISDKLQEQAIKILEDNGFEVIKKYGIISDDLKEEIGDYDGIIIRSRTKLRNDILEKAKKLKVIGRAGVGLDNIDLKKARELNIQVLNTPEAPSISVAELVIGLIISLARNLSKADETMHCGEWHKSEYMGYTLNGKKIGLIGFGHVGKEVAKRCKVFGMKIGVFDIVPSIIEKARELGYDTYSSIDELVKDAQIISLHIPATSQTENTINERRLNLMNEKTIIINTARGKLIDEAALIKALKNNLIGGAALDVYWKEPLENKELYSIKDNLLLTPHLGSQTQETQIQASVIIAEKISDFLK
ncbi:MAG: hydroxyacid dehydrogenase [Promethearchaeota archaeon]